MRKTRILIVDSDPVIRRFIRANLEARNFEALVAMDGAEAMQTFERELPDLAVINVTLKDMTGKEVCRKIREWSQMPVIMISSQDNDKGKVECFDMGADDFLDDALDIEELTARIRAVFRRTGKLNNNILLSSFNVGDLKIRFSERRVTVADREIKLTPTEYNLLQELALNSNKVLSHSVLLNKVWGPEYGQEREYLRVFVGRLRKKLEPDASKPNYIVTIPWVGYKLESNEEASPLNEMKQNALLIQS